LRYRPFGRAGVSVSVIALALDDRAAQRGPEALKELIYGAMEAGVNTFHIECSDPDALAVIGEALAAVERQLLVVSLRLGLRPGRTGLTRDFSPEALTGAIDHALQHSGLEHLDLVLLDEPGEDEFPTAALTALKMQRTTGRVGLLGIGGCNNAMDVYLEIQTFDVLATPFHLRSGWKERNRVKAAANFDMGVIAYDYFPDAYRQPAATPGAPKKRGLFGAALAAPADNPLQGVGTYAFLHETRNWTAEELCLAYAVMEPNVSTVLIRPRELEQLTALAAVPDRDLPPGVAAQAEMARFSAES
jgi:aryl-alcohol dehydrogenase-like predicted oxidoreductase